MSSFGEIIEAFGGAAEFGLAIGIAASHARTMLARGSIPSEYWTAVVDAAASRGIEGVTLDVLARLAAAKRKTTEAAA